MSVIAPISTYLQRATCFTDWRYIITSEETTGGGGGERRYSNLLSRQYRFSSSWHEMFLDVSPEILVFQSLMSARLVLELVECSLVRSVSMFDFSSSRFLMNGATC